MPRRPVHHLRAFHYNDHDGVMEGDRNHVDTYQQDAGQAGPNTPPITINVNLGEILSGLGLKEMISQLLAHASAGGKVNESSVPKIPRTELIEAVSLGADPSEVLDLLSFLEGIGALE